MTKILTAIFFIVSIYFLIIQQFRNITEAASFRNTNLENMERSDIPFKRGNSKSNILGEFLEDDDFDFNEKRQVDDYGHMRFGKRGDDHFDDYGHLRFGRFL